MKLFIELPTGLRISALLASLAAGIPAAAGELYQCVEANRKVTYSDTACKDIGNAGKERAIVFQKAPPPSVRPKAIAPRASGAAHTDPAIPVMPKPKAVIRFFYDPKDAPEQHPVMKVEAMILRAIDLWTSGCAVYLEYVGTAPRLARSSPEAVSIFWLPGLADVPHPANDAFTMGGYGGLHAGIAIQPGRANEDAVAFVIMHEMGHVLGLKHIHEDRRSVMSYIRDQAWQYDLRPTADDYLQCNWAIKKRYGVKMELPPEPWGSMNDKEAVLTKYPDLRPRAR